MLPLVIILSGYVYAQFNTEYEVTVFVPQGWEWKDFVIVAGHGTFEMNSSMDFIVETVNINLCEGISFLSQIEISDAVVLREITACAGDIYFEGDLGETSFAKLDSSRRAEVVLSSSFLGSVELLYGSLQLSGKSECLWEYDGANTASGFCGEASSQLMIDADQLYLSFLVKTPSSSSSPSPFVSMAVTPSTAVSASASTSQTPLTTGSTNTPSTTVLSASTTTNGASISTTSTVVASASAPQTRLASASSTIVTSASTTQTATATDVANTPSSSTTPTDSVIPSPSESNTPSSSESNTPSPSESASASPSNTPLPSASMTPSASASSSSTPLVCGPNYSDPAGTDNIPLSGPVSSSWINPGNTLPLEDGSTDWSSSNWGTSPIVSNFDSNTVQINAEQWSPKEIFMYTTSTLVSLIDGAVHELSFSLWQKDTNTFNSIPGDLTTQQFNITLAVLDFLPDSTWKWRNEIENGACDADCTVLEFIPFLENSVIPTTSATALDITVSFTSAYNGDAVLMLFIEQPGQTSASSGNEYYFGSPVFERFEVTRSFPAPITVSSPYVDVPVAPQVPMPTQSNCPHLRSDLVNWHDPSIWPGNQVPAADGSDITIPDGLSVLISSCSIDPNTYGTIYVPTNTELIFADSDMQIRVGNIHVNGGHLWIGSESCRIYSHITITLDDSASTISQLVGRKGISSTGSGVIDMHGKLFQQTWTRIAAPALVNDDRVLLMEDINWEVGQQVALITTIWDDHRNPQNEVLTIAAIDGRKVQFEERIQYYHHAGEEYQAEIALLSRRILIQGDEASEDSHVGGHILSSGDIGRFSGVQAYRMGQTNVLARYPFHFHMMDDSPESYFRDCSVYHSFYRCFTIHGTHSAMLSRNTAFDVLGHCFYIEDGVEELNTFEYNLAAYPQPLEEIDFYANGYGQDGITINQSPTLLIPADGAVSGYYISNANNHFFGNTASGGFAGFSFINFPAPIGSHRTSPVVPERRPLASFYGNTAHSASYQWQRAGCIYTGGNQEYDDNDELFYNVGRKSRYTQNANGTAVDWMIFEETRVYLCNRGLNHWGDRAELHGYAAHDVTKGATLFGEAYVNRVVIDGRSSNTLGYRPNPVRAFEYYDISVKTILDDVTIMNLYEAEGYPTNTGTYGIVSMTHSDKFKPQGINAARNISWQNVWEGGRFGNTIRDTGASRFYNIMDWDGSLLDTGVATIIGSANDQEYGFGDDPTQRIKEWWNIHSSCVLHPEFTLYACDKQSDQEIVNIYIDVNGVTNDVTLWNSIWPEQPSRINVGTVSHFGYSGSARRSGIITANPGITSVSGDIGMYAFFDGGNPQELFLRATQIPVVDGNPMHIIFGMKFPTGIEFDITTEHLWKSDFSSTVTLASSFSDMYDDPDGTKYYLLPSTDNPSEQWLFMKLIYRHFDGNTPESSGYYERNGIRLYDVTHFYWYRVATCATAPCPTYTGTVPVWDVVDEVPPFVSDLRQ